MNMVLNTPMPTFVSKQEYDNKILYIFLGLMTALVVLSMVFISLTKEITNNSATTDEQVQPIQVGEYV